MFLSVHGIYSSTIASVKKFKLQLFNNIENTTTYYCLDMSPTTIAAISSNNVTMESALSGNRTT